MTLSDLTLVMTDDVKVALQYRRDVIFTGTIEDLFKEPIWYNNKEVESTHFLGKNVADVYHSIMYNAIMITID